MKLIIKNHLFKVVVYDSTNQPLYQIKSRAWGAKELIQTIKNRILYCTDIIDLEASPVSGDSSASRQYMVYQESRSGEPVVIASLGYVISSDQDAMRSFPFRVPQVNRLNIQIHSSKNLRVTIHLLKDGSCVICDQQNQILGKISGYRLFTGYIVECNIIEDGGLLCALFVLTRYMVKENELIIV